MRAKKTHVIVLIVSVIMLFGSMGIAVFAADETASDNSAATTEQIVQDEVQPDAVAEETAPAKAEAKGASLGDMKAAESGGTATGSSICVITYDAGKGTQYSAFLNDPVKLADLIETVGINNSAIKGDKTWVDHAALLSVTPEGGQYYVSAIGKWTKETNETIHLCNSAGTTVATIAATAKIVSAEVGKDIKTPVAKEGLTYKVGGQALIKKAGSTPVGKMQYTLAGANASDVNWSDDVSSITGTDVQDYTVYWRVINGNNNLLIMAGSVEAAIGKADPKVIPPKPLKPTPLFDGTAKQIATEGSTTAGNMKYYVGEEPGDNTVWSDDLMKEECMRTEAGKYKVWYKVVCNESEAQNYNDVAPKSIEAKIEGKEVVVSVKVDDKVYDGQVIQPGAVSFTYNGETKADPPEEVDVSVTFYEDPLHLFKTTKSDGIGEDKANGSAPKYEGTYYVEANATPKDPSSSYEYESAKNLKFTISPKPVTITWSTKKTFEYNGKEQAPEATVTTGVTGESLAAVVSDAEKDAGKYTATVKDLKPAGLASNYVLPKDSSASTDYTITPKPVTVIWTNDDGCKDIHILNGSKHKVKAAIVGAVNGEELLPKYAPNSVIEAKAAGTYKGIVNGVLIKKLIIIKTETFNYQLVDADGKDISESTYPWMISNPEDDPVADVIALIKALDPNAADYNAKAWIAVEAFNALTKGQQADSRFREQEVATKLAGAQYEVAAEADQKAAKPVMDKIDALTANSSKAQVEAARAAYDRLSYAQKAACGQSRSFTLQSQEYRIYSGEAKVKKVNGYKVKNVKGKKARATWKATSDVDGYKITYKAKGVKTKTVYANASASKKTLTKLKKNKKYTVKIRSFNLVYNPLSGTDEKVFGKTSTKKVKIKK